MTVSLNMNYRSPFIMKEPSFGRLGPKSWELHAHNKENVELVRNYCRGMEVTQNYDSQSTVKRQNLQSKGLQREPLGVKFIYANSRQPRVASAEVRVPAHFQKLNGPIPQEEKVSGHFRKKSVRFNEDSLELEGSREVRKLKGQKGGSLLKEVVRNRSSSILKNKSRSERKREEGSLNKQEQRSSTFSISEYKNTIIRERYHQLLKCYRYEADQRQSLAKSYSSANISNSQGKSKYHDSNFLRVNSCLFRDKQCSGVRWLRISQLMRGKKVQVLKEESRVVAVKEAGSFANANFVAMINLIRSSRNLLSKIFENAVYNEEGVYMLKIFQDYQWKCIIIDDFIPVFHTDHRQPLPVFTRIRQIEEKIEIWPFLLQKAYASAFGCYEAVHESTLLSYFCQMMGLPVDKVDLKSRKEWRQELKMSTKQAIVFGFLKTDKISHDTQKYPMRIRMLSSGSEDSDRVQVEQISTNRGSNISISELNELFEELFIVRTPNLHHFVSTNIVIGSRFGKSIKNKRCFNQTATSTSLCSESMSSRLCDARKQKNIIKTFTVRAPQEISLIVKHKMSGHKNKVGWLRVLLFMKELDSYRWIEGQYASEFVSFHCVLEPGQYYLVIFPDWTLDYTGEYTLIIYSRVNLLQIENCTESKAESIIQKGCSDYAQRIGRMVQINKWICAYSIVDQRAGLIIENINNERSKGQVKIYRSINNVKPKNCCLMPLNEDFYHEGKLRNQIEVCLEEEQSYSVVLMLFGGRDDEFMARFNFGL